MKNQLSLNNIRQGNWTDIQQNLLREKLLSFFLIPTQNHIQPSMRITNHLLQRLVLLAGLSRTDSRNKEVIQNTELKNATYFDSIFHNDDFYPLLTALLKVHYHQIAIDWENKVEVSKLINYEMEAGVKLLLETNCIDNLLGL